MRFLLTLLTLCLLCGCNDPGPAPTLRLCYDRPANDWNEALPVGNGRSGAMVFGRPETEHLQLNENTLYSGEPSTVFKDIEITPEAFDTAVSFLKKGKYAEATEFICRNWLGRLHQYYQPVGDLYLTHNNQGDTAEYRRELDISEALLKTSYLSNGTRYEREIFASNPENAIIVHVKGNRPDALDMTVQFTSPHPTAIQKWEDGMLVLRGQAPGYAERRTFEQIEAWGDQYKHPELFDSTGKKKTDKRVLYGPETDGKGMRFEARVKAVLPAGGRCEATDSGLRISGTGEAYFIVSQATSFNGFDKSPSTEGTDESQKAKTIIEGALKHDYRTLKKRHTGDYRALFDRVSFWMPSDETQRGTTTDRRIPAFRQKTDPDLAALLFQYGRYLMISGSRPGGQPLNLQGLWNKDIVPPWNCGYTMNINAEMNYWMAETANLGECQAPLFDMIGELAVTGAETARDMYHRRGWVAHHNTSVWRESQPNDNVPPASFWPMAQGWLCRHLWEHYAFTGDRQFLCDKAYPLIRGAAEFFADWLIEDGEGHLVTPAGISPENTFLTDGGKTATISMGPTMDMAIVRETLTNAVRISEILDTDLSFRKELEEKLSKLLPYRIGSRGQLQEWMYDFRETDPQHRHLSHLYGFYPGDQITPDATPELFDAVKKTLEIRGDAATGWSMGWKINCWARLADGNHAHRIIENLFNPVGFGPERREGGGLYLNLLDACPPFQIDGNFGYAAGVIEMLLQSHAGFIQLLPALPDAWPEGKISGLKARGNFEISIEWKKGSLDRALVRSEAGNRCRLRTAVPVRVKGSDKDNTASIPVASGGRNYFETAFDTDAGQTYEILPE